MVLDLRLQEKTILEGLNPEQIKAVTFGEGPLLIIAGAGTGKTTVITRRIAYLIARKKAKPSEILALTFTDKAAYEMEERVDILVPYGYVDVRISTFHAFGDRALRENALELGLNFDFKVLSLPEQIIFLRENIFNLPLNRYRPLGNPTAFLGSLATLISRAKDEDITPKEYLQFTETLEKKSQENPSGEQLSEVAEKHLELARTYKKYQELMAKAGFIDFGDQVYLLLKLFRKKPSILRKYQEQFKYILVDEFQDTNFAQYQLLKLLGAKNHNITVVGDDDQSIYKFRGAAISNILSFSRDYPELHQVVLKTNYRSPQTILDSAYKLITHNNPERLEVKNKVDKRLISIKTKPISVKYLHFDTLSSEADKIASLVQEKVKSGYKYSDIAILVRSNREADPYLRALNMKSIPYIFSGQQGLYDQPEVRLFISILKTLADPYDNLSLYALAGSSLYNIDQIELTQVLSIAKRKNLSLLKIFRNLESFEELTISKKTFSIIKKLVEDIENYVKLGKDLSTGHLLYKFINKKNLIADLVREETSESDTAISNMARFFEIIYEFELIYPHSSVVQFINHLELLIQSGDNPATSQVDFDTQAVNVLTVHKAKGLEFPIVIVVDLVKGRFPCIYRKEQLELPLELIKDTLPGGDFHLQEERRLFYVGMTRAQEELYFTSARDYGTKRPKKVSQFVLEALDLPKTELEPFKSTAAEYLKRFQTPPERPLPDHMIASDKILNLSHYKIDDYVSCPLRYKYIHILKVPVLPHHNIIYGKILHDTIYFYHQSKIAGRKVTSKELEDTFKRLWTNDGFLTRQHEELRFQTGLEAIKKYYKTQEKSKFIPLEAEKEFSFIIDDIRITGRWDRLDKIDDKIIITDYKSSDIRDQAEAAKRAKESLQLTIYALACQQMHGRLPDIVQLYFLNSGIIGGCQKKQTDIKKAILKIKESASGIRKSQFPAKPDYMNCQFCSYKEICLQRYK